jgi:hypothetical protein
MRHRTILSVVLLLPLTGCVTSLGELRALEPYHVTEVEADADMLSACTLRSAESSDDIDPIYHLRQSSDPITHRHDLTARRISDMFTMRNAYEFEASFIPVAPGRTRVESRGTWYGKNHLVGEPMWRHIDSCSKQLEQKK